MKKKFNQKNCSRKKLLNHTQYTLDGQLLKQVDHISDVGITVSSDLLSTHIEVTAAKAKKTRLGNM